MLKLSTFLVLKGWWIIFWEFSVKFRGLQKISGNPRKMLGHFENCANMARRKSHAFDPEKVGSYKTCVHN